MANDYQSRPQRNKPQHKPETDITGRMPPHDDDLEAAVLGALMLETDAFAKVCDIIRSPAYFYSPANQKVFEAIQTLGVQQQPIDFKTVKDQLAKMGTLDEVGGALYIADLGTGIASAAHIEWHARILAQQYLARELITFGTELTAKAFDQTNDVDDVLNEAEGHLFELSQRNVKNEVVPIDSLVPDAIANIQAAASRETGLSGLASGYPALDRMTSGWQNSDLIIIAARPAMGKTAMVLSMAKNMAISYNTKVAIFSLEMSKLQLVNRLIQNVCEIEGEKIKSGRLSEREWNQMLSRIGRLQSAPIYIDDSPGLSILELRTKARRLVRERGVQFIVIDYLQLMNASGMKFGSREQEVSMISRSLKELAKELNIPIVALSQLNRSVESRAEDKRPQLSDLRESGAIEQDADIVCFIHRPEYYLHGAARDDKPELRGKAEFIIAKHRSGSVGDVELRFRGQYARFENWSDVDIMYEQTSEASALNSDLNNNDPLGAANPGNPLQGGTADIAGGGDAPF